MSFKLRCYTLFDIAQTGVSVRRNVGVDEDESTWRYKRDTQCNFDTILQSISLRSQPEITKIPEKIKIRFDEFTNFGFLYNQDNEESYECSVFEFDIQHPSVFNDGINELGALYDDCHGVPMIKCGKEWEKLSDEEVERFYKDNIEEEVR